MKKFYLLLLSAIMGTAANAQIWDGTAAAWTQGDGSSSNPYLIENGQHLAYLSETVRNGETYEGKYFKLTTDLDMGINDEQKFTSIGFFDEYIDSENQGGGMIDDSKYFLGVFDGNYKTIDNIHVYYVDPNPENTIGGTGLFACISKNAEIKNLNIGENSIIEGADATGAIVGAMNGGKVINCSNNAILTIINDGPYGAGGIVGTNNGGGIISGCSNSTNINGHNNVGGIVGYVDKSGIIENCYNTGMITVGGFFAGGICGYLTSGTARNCYTTGNVPSDGIFNQAVIGATDAGVTIENCYYLNIPNAATDENAGVTAKEEADMKTESFITDLNNGQNIWVTDSKNMNQGFPVLSWQVDPTPVSTESIQEANINVYAIGHNLYIQSEASCQAIISDISGKIIVNENIDNKTITLDNKGLYIVTILSNGQKYNHKVIIK